MTVIVYFLIVVCACIFSYKSLQYIMSMFEVNEDDDT